MPRLLWSIQQPVVECLVAESNAAKLFTPVDIPGTHTHPNLLGPCVFLVVLTHSQQYSWGGCRAEESGIRVGIGLTMCVCVCVRACRKGSIQ